MPAASTPLPKVTAPSWAKNLCTTGSASPEESGGRFSTEALGSNNFRLLKGF